MHNYSVSNRCTGGGETVLKALLVIIELDVSNLLLIFPVGLFSTLNAHYNHSRSFKDILMFGPRMEAAKCSHRGLDSDPVSTIFNYVNVYKLLTSLSFLICKIGCCKEQRQCI